MKITKELFVAKTYRFHIFRIKFIFKLFEFIYIVTICRTTKRPKPIDGTQPPTNLFMDKKTNIFISNHVNT